MPDDGYDALMQELLQMFAVEAAEHIQTLNQTLLKLERQPDSNEKQELLNAAFRAAHSLKGSARAVELMDIEGVSHDAEAVLSAVRAGKMEINPDMVDVLLSATDLIQNLVDGQQLEAGQMDAVRQKLKTIAEGGTPQNALAESKPVASESTKPAEVKPAPESPGKPAEVKSPQKPPTITIEQSAGDSSLDVLMQELLQMFAVEAVEHLTTLSQSLMALEKDLPEERHKTELNAAFRAAHSLKGSARALELMEIEGVSHEAEAVLSAVRSGSLHMNSDIVDVLLDATDIISNLVGGEAVSEDQLNDIKTRLKDAEQGKLASKAAPPPESTPPPVKPPEAPSLPAPVKTEAAPKQTPTALAEWQAALDKKETKSKPAIKPSPLSTGATEETIRVSVEKLDDLMAQAGELIVSKISADERLRELRDLRTLMSRWEKTWAETSELQRRIDRLSRQDDDHDEWKEVLEFLSDSHRYLTQSVEKMRALDKAMTSDNMRMTLVTQAIQEEIRRVRMLPVETLVPTLQRVVRDVARASEKKAELVIRGADVELDKRVLEDLKDPLVHLLRNSVDHGIEIPEARLESGKPEIGIVTVAVTQRGGNVHIVVADDGKGLDAEAIRHSSVEKGMIHPNEAETMSDEEVYLLIFQAGLSTKKEVTSVSGRGVGMDVVKAQLENLQGRINVKSVTGEGTEFHLIVPISLATIRGLIVRIGIENYAMPLHSVEKIITIRPDSVYFVEGNRMFDYNHEPMQVVHMADVIERPRDPDRTDRLMGLILAGAERRMAFLVDDFISEQEMVVKPLGKQLQRVRNVAGATLLGTGRPIVILNATDLIKSAQGGRIVHHPVFVDRSKDQEVEKPPSRILVVDDSITTRTLERNILQGAGYEVLTAIDGVEALALLETEKINLVVSDIEMPRIDGFELVEWIRQSPVYGDVPIVLVTSLESQEHRERGLKAGADAYIVKSGFEQSALLETIEQFL